MSISVTHVNFADNRGGAARIASQIISEHDNHGVRSRLLCARPTKPDSLLLGFGFRDRAGLPLKLLHKVSRLRNEWFGDTYGICGGLYLQRIGQTRPDIIHLHNIHDGWFSLSLLPKLASVAPLIWTLHDEWAITGHCTSALGCERWRNGCHRCSSLDTFVPLRWDTARMNRLNRNRIYRKIPAQRLVMVTPSNWLGDRVRISGLWGGRIETIHNGVDTRKFFPTDQRTARAKLKITPEARVVLFIAADGLDNPFKNGRTFLEALCSIPSHINLIALILGGSVQQQLSQVASVSLVMPGYVNDVADLRLYYSAADLVVYPTKADSFGLIVAEAMACGTPVLATRVGAMTEQIENKRNGFLVNDNVSPAELAQVMIRLLANRELLHKMRDSAVKSVKEKYSARLMGKRYFDLYTDMVNSCRSVNDHGAAHH